MTRRLGEEPVEHAAHGSDTRACSDEYGVAHRILKNEISVRSVEIDQSTSFQIAEVIRKESVGDAVETDVEGALIARRRRDGIGTRDFASIMQGLHGDELSGNEIERRRLDFK